MRAPVVERPPAGVFPYLDETGDAPLSTDCHSCTATTDGHHLCRRCTGYLTTALSGVPELAQALDDSISRRVRHTSGVGVASKTADTPLPVNLHAADVSAHLHNTLAEWVRNLAERTGDDALPAEDTAALAAWLRHHTSVMRTHPAAGDCAAALLDATRRGWRAVDRPAQPSYSGPCDDCGADLYGRPAAVELSCTDCGAVYDAAVRREWLLDQARDQLATASTIARALPMLLGQHVTPAMIRGYAHRGRLASRPGVRGRPRYRVGDVIDLVAAS